MDPRIRGTSGGPLYARNPTGRFSRRAEDYKRYRPSYPEAALGAVLEDLGRPASLVCADVGAGTGISSRLVAERGVRVIAIEPNAAMREAADPHPLVEWRDGTAEATGLTDRSVHIVLCAQAFHWFRPKEARAEFARILRPGGRIALMWNLRDDKGDALTGAYGAAVKHAARGDPAASKHPGDNGLNADAGFVGFRLFAFPYAQQLDWDGLLGRATSSSYVPTQGDAYDELVRELRAAYDRHVDTAGLVFLRYTTELYLAERASC
jgi:SAM-dependent methyltransferase